MAGVFEIKMKIAKCKQELREAQCRNDETEIGRLEKQISMLETELNKLINQDKDKKPEFTM